MKRMYCVSGRNHSGRRVIKTVPMNVPTVLFTPPSITITTNVVDVWNWNKYALIDEFIYAMNEPEIPANAPDIIKEITFTL